MFKKTNKHSFIFLTLILFLLFPFFSDALTLPSTNVNSLTQGTEQSTTTQTNGFGPVTNELLNSGINPETGLPAQAEQSTQNLGNIAPEEKESSSVPPIVPFSCPRSSCVSDPLNPVMCPVVDFGICFIQGLAQSFMLLGSAILDFFIGDNFLGFGYTASDNKIIEFGWPIVRNLANAALLIGLIVVAINIILGNNEDKAKKDLINFIIIALLINFTPVICSFIINAADIIMKNFLVPLDFGYNDGIYQKANSMLTDNQGVRLINTFFLIIFSIVTFTIYCLYAILFAARKIVLWILVIVSPVALVTKVFPQSTYVKKIFPSIMHWDDWSEQFAQWTVIGIPAGLFMYLANQLMAKLSEPGVVNQTEIIGLLVANSLPLVFLIIGFMITTSAGGQVGSFVGGLGAGAWAATAGKAATKAKALGREAYDRTAGWGMERAGRAKDVAKEGLMGMAAGAISGDMNVFKGGDAGIAAREAGRYKFREVLGKPREAFTKAGLADPNTLNIKSEAQKAAEEKAKGIDLEHYEANRTHYSDTDRIAIEKKLMDDNMGKFLKGAKTPEEYQRRILSIQNNGSTKAKEQALMAAYGNSNLKTSPEELAKNFKLDLGEKPVEEFIAKKIKDKDSVGIVSKEFLEHATANQMLSPDQYAKIARDGDKEKIEAINKKMADVDPEKLVQGLGNWYHKAGAASAVYDWKNVPRPPKTQNQSTPDNDNHTYG